MKTATRSRKQINWSASKDEIVVIKKIATRAYEMAQSQGFSIEFNEMMMDVTACHLNGNSLDLDKLLHANDFNFAHDVWGIHRHISRETGELMNFFLPRSTKQIKSHMSAIVLVIALCLSVQAHADGLSKVDAAIVEQMEQERIDKAVYVADQYKSSNDPLLLKTPQQYVAEARDEAGIKSMENPLHDKSDE